MGSALALVSVFLVKCKCHLHQIFLHLLQEPRCLKSHLCRRLSLLRQAPLQGRCLEGWGAVTHPGQQGWSEQSHRGGRAPAGKVWAALCRNLHGRFCWHEGCCSVMTRDSSALGELHPHPALAGLSCLLGSLQGRRRVAPACVIVVFLEIGSAGRGEA